MRIRNAAKKDKKGISELYYELHPIEEKENKEAIKLYKDVGFELGKRSLWFYWNSKKKIK